MAHASSITLVFNEKEYVVERATLRRWLELEDIKDNIKKAVEIGNNGEIARHIYAFISTALRIEGDFSSLSWQEVSSVFGSLYQINTPTQDFPLLRAKIKDKSVAWDYEGRSWYIWLHLFSSSYGWSGEYIEKLDVDDAIALSQEIIVEEQLAKEWEWALSDRGISYDKASKKSRFTPLERPDWMRMMKEFELPIVKMPKFLLPVGNVVSYRRDKDDPIDA